MKATVVPAQITTVEDKIAGNLSVTQLLLLIAPVMLTGMMFAFVPPLLQLTGLKLALALIAGLTCASLALRIRGTLLVYWLLTISRYNRRPRFHVLDKNEPYLRYIETPFKLSTTESKNHIDKAPLRSTSLQQLATVEVVRLQAAMADPRSKFQLLARKGGLRVSIFHLKDDNL